MNNKKLLQAGGLAMFILLVAVLAIVTQEAEDPCANPQAGHLRGHSR